MLSYSQTCTAVAVSGSPEATPTAHDASVRANGILAVFCVVAHIVT